MLFYWQFAQSIGKLPKAMVSISEKANQQLRLLWMTCGTEDRLITINHDLSDWLTTRGVAHTWVPVPGVHSSRVWRPALAQFAPLLFQPKK